MTIDFDKAIQTAKEASDAYKQQELQIDEQQKQLMLDWIANHVQPKRKRLVARPKLLFSVGSKVRENNGLWKEKKSNNSNNYFAQ